MAWQGAARPGEARSSSTNNQKGDLTMKCPICNTDQWLVAFDKPMIEDKEQWLAYRISKPFDELGAARSYRDFNTTVVFTCLSCETSFT